MSLCTDEAGRDFIASNEGLVVTISNDNGHQVIGYGHDLSPQEISSGMYADGISTLQAQLILESDCAKWDVAINTLGWILTQSQHNALADFTHQMGITALHELASHGQAQVAYQMYHQDPDGTQHGWIFERDVYGNMVAVPGIVVRRLKDIALWNQ